MTTKPSIFVSYVSDNREIANRLAAWIRDKFLEGVEVFVSGDGLSIKRGDEWFPRIEQSLRKSKLMIVLCSKQALKKHWIYFESGGAYFLQARVIPLCLPGCTIRDLPDPLKYLQACEINNSTHFRELVKIISEYAGLNEPTYEADRELKDIIGILPTEIISDNNKIKAYKKRTEAILDALNEINLKNGIIRQAASLSSYAISSSEIAEGDVDGSLRSLLLSERKRFEELLEKGILVRLIVCPSIQVARVYQEEISVPYIETNILTRYDQLINMIEKNIDKPNLQIVQSFTLEHENLLIIDDKQLLVGKKSVRDKGFSITERTFDPQILQTEIKSFDSKFHDNAANILKIESPTDEDYGSQLLKSKVVERLQISKGEIERKIAIEKFKIEKKQDEGRTSLGSI